MFSYHLWHYSIYMVIGCLSAKLRENFKQKVVELTRLNGDRKHATMGMSMILCFSLKTVCMDGVKPGIVK